MSTTTTLPRAAVPAIRLIAWAPLVVLPVLLGVVLSAWEVPRWVLMWSLAFSIYACLKWLTLLDTPERREAPLTRQAAYLLLWAGMNARTFLAGPSPARPRPAAREWALAFGKVVLGFVLIHAAVPRLLAWNELLAGWVGMAGIAFVLHFGVLHVVSLAWQAAGYSAPPIMHKPHRAVSLAEFWGRRWNTAFRDLAHRYVFKPLAPARGVLVATLAVFVASAAIHEVVITPSAQGGSGLPSLYFLLQGAAQLFERSTLGKRLGLGAGWRGRVYCLLVIALPAVMCFPPAFIHRVTLPFLQALGAF